MAAAPMDFNTIMAQAAQLNTQLDLTQYKVSRGVKQIHEQTKRLLEKTGPSGDLSKSRAQLLLATKGYDADKVAQKLNSINLKTTFEPAEPIADTDVAGFLRNENQNILTSAIDEAKQETLRAFNTRSSSALDSEWKQKKSELMERYGQRRGEWQSAADAMLDRTQNTTVLSQSMNNLSFANPMTPGRRGRSALTGKQRKYAQVINKLSESLRTPGRDRFDLMGALYAETNSMDDIVTKQELLDTWQLLARTANTAADGRAPGFGELTDAYERNQRDLRQKLVDGARMFLEDQYKAVLLAVVKENRMQAPRGGEPGLLADIRTFVSIRDDFRGPGITEKFNGEAVWPLIFLCLRCGDLNQALAVTHQAAGSPFFGKFDQYMNEYAINPNHRLDNPTWNRLIREYKVMESECSDPYKLAVYCVIGRIIPAPKTHANTLLKRVTANTQDYMWLKLSLIVEDGSVPENVSSDPNQHSLERLQKLVAETYGAKHFDPDYTKPLFYAQVLFLTAQFERGIEYLYTFERYQVDAVHMAVALGFCGLLRTNVSPESQMVVQLDELKLGFNLVALVKQYTGTFARTDPRDALTYLTLLRSGTDKMNAIRDLVVETQEFDVLLGTMQVDGTIRPGAIQQLIDDPNYVRDIIMRAGELCEAEGKTEAAIKLGVAAQNWEAVVGIVSREISQVLVPPFPEREKKKELAMSIHNQITQQNKYNEIRPQTVETFYILMELVGFFDRNQAGNYQEVIQLMDSLELLPRDSSEVAGKVDTFRALDAIVQRHAADILLTTMTALYKLYGQRKGAGVQSPGFGAPMADGGREQVLQELRTRARALITYAGLLQYRLPGDTNARLLKMEVFMT